MELTKKLCGPFILELGKCNLTPCGKIADTPGILLQQTINDEYGLGPAFQLNQELTIFPARLLDIFFENQQVLIGLTGLFPSLGTDQFPGPVPSQLPGRLGQL